MLQNLASVLDMCAAKYRKECQRLHELLIIIAKRIPERFASAECANLYPNYLPHK